MYTHTNLNMMKQSHRYGGCADCTHSQDEELKAITLDMMIHHDVFEFECQKFEKIIEINKLLKKVNSKKKERKSSTQPGWELRKNNNTEIDYTIIDLKTDKIASKSKVSPDYHGEGNGGLYQVTYKDKTIEYISIHEKDTYIKLTKHNLESYKKKIKSELQKIVVYFREFYTILEDYDKNNPQEASLITPHIKNVSDALRYYMSQ